jgi:hypothetical protein
VDTDAEKLASTRESSPHDEVSLLWDEPASSKIGTLLAAEGRSRYVGSKLWRNIGALGESDDEGQAVEETPTQVSTNFLLDPLADAFIGSRQVNLLQYHPTHEEAMVMWKKHIENVEPLCKILHLPSVSSMVRRLSKEPAMASPDEECLLFAVYHFAVFSMTEEDCTSNLGQPRSVLLQRYNFATRHALNNAGFIKTAQLPILQAFVLYLMASPHPYEPHTYWIMTGVAVRIAQRIGLHRDGEKLGLPPFETEMRRRLFYQLMPLDAKASQMAGMSAPILPDSWDTRRPLNINDDQIWPGMIETPEEQKGATDMIFCLSRICLGEVFVKSGTQAAQSPAQFRNPAEADLVIRQAESAVEEKYIRYCDVVNPLHFLSTCMARCGITAMRLRVRLPKAMSQTATDAETREAFQLAVKILDTDAAVCGHAGVRKYRWHVQSFFLWGTWDSIIFVLTSLWKKGGVFSADKVNAAWEKVESLYHHHDELLTSKRALYVALGRLALKAWEATPSRAAGSGTAEAEFISVLQSKNMPRSGSKEQSNGTSVENGKEKTDGLESYLLFGVDNASPGGSIVYDGTSWPELGDGFDVEAMDWSFWDQLLQGHETWGTEE